MIKMTRHKCRMCFFRANTYKELREHEKIPVKGEGLDILLFKNNAEGLPEECDLYTLFKESSQVSKEHYRLYSFYMFKITKEGLFERFRASFSYNTIIEGLSTKDFIPVDKASLPRILPLIIEKYRLPREKFDYLKNDKP